VSGRWVALQPAPWKVAAGGAGLLLNLPGTNALGQRIAQVIDEARRDDTLFVITPVLEDDAAIEALLAARARGARTKVITKLAEHRDGKLRFATRSDVTGEDLDAHFHATRRLTLGRIRIKSPQFLPHAKLVIAKGKVAIFSSANLTSNSLGSGFSSAVEAGLCFTAAEQVRDLAQAFVALWDSCGMAQDLYEERIALQSVQAVPLRQETLPTKIGDTLELCWSCHGVSDSLRKRLIEEILKAKSRILLAAMSFYDADRVPELESALLAALARGVEVTVIVRPEQFSAKQYPDPSTRRLLAAGLRLFGITGFHAKGFLVDRDHCGILSANFNPYSIGGGGVSSNFEMALCGERSDKALTPFAEFLCALPGAATHRFEIE